MKPKKRMKRLSKNIQKNLFKTKEGKEMNIKSNKNNDDFISISKFIKKMKQAIRTRHWWYYIPLLSYCFIELLLNLNDVGWGPSIINTIAFYILTILFWYLGEQDYINNEYYDGAKWFPLLFSLLMISIISYSVAFKPIITDYNTEKRINKIIDKNVSGTILWNDRNCVIGFKLKDSGNMLVHIFSQSCETYYKLKSTLLEKNEYMIKKEVKHWYDDVSETEYSLHEYKFD